MQGLRLQPLPLGESGDGRGQEKSTAGAGIFDAEPRETVYFACGERRGKASRLPRQRHKSGGPAASKSASGIKARRAKTGADRLSSREPNPRYAETSQTKKRRSQSHASSHRGTSINRTIPATAQSSRPSRHDPPARYAEPACRQSASHPSAH